VSVAAEDIRDIRGPVPIPVSWHVPAAIVAGLLLAAAIVWLVRRRRRRSVPLAAPPTADAVALAALEGARMLMDPARAREFGIAVSDAVRTYIEARFDARAAHRTTEEFLHDLMADGTAGLAPHRTLLADFLGHCDLAKFAREPLTVPDMDAMLASAVTFVRRTAATPTA